MTTSHDIDRMIEELKAAGWKPQTPTIWKSPAGALHLGPAGAWRKMVAARTDDAVAKGGRLGTVNGPRAPQSEALSDSSSCSTCRRLQQGLRALQRYDENFAEFMTTAPDGEWVSWSDIQALLAAPDPPDSET